MKFITLLLENHRLRMGIIFLGTIMLLSVGFILEYIVGLTPCPLCIIQRFFFGLTGLLGLLYFMQKLDEDNRTLKIYSGIMMFFSFIGGTFAARQIWLTYNPPSLLGTNCAPWLGSITEIIKATFKATADCAEMGWTLLHLSIPEWSLISFIGLFILSSIPFWKK